MSNEIQYYKTIDDIVITEENYVKEDEIKFLTAKMAREITNNVILSKLKEMLDNDVKKTALEGLDEYKFSINKKYDTTYIINVLKDLGYKTSVINTTNDKIWVRLAW